jgi:hypothetical protein
MHFNAAVDSGQWSVVSGLDGRNEIVILLLQKHSNFLLVLDEQLLDILRCTKELLKIATRKSRLAITATVSRTLSRH